MSLYFYCKKSTTQHIHSTQHTQYTTTHSTSHHITFCICLVLILVCHIFGFSASFQGRRRRHIVRVVPVVFQCFSPHVHTCTNAPATVSDLESGLSETCVSTRKDVNYACAGQKSGKTLAKVHFDIDGQIVSKTWVLRRETNRTSGLLKTNCFIW